MSNIYLKVKIKSLAAEAVIIRREEAKQRRIQNWAKPKKEVVHNPTDGTHTRVAPYEPHEAEYDAALSLRISLRSHRTEDVRGHARATLIAYAFLRGKDYGAMEPLVYTSPDWLAIERMIAKYSTEDARVWAQRFHEWKGNAKHHLQRCRDGLHKVEEARAQRREARREAIAHRDAKPASSAA